MLWKSREWRFAVAGAMKLEWTRMVAKRDRSPWQMKNETPHRG